MKQFFCVAALCTLMGFALAASSPGGTMVEQWKPPCTRLPACITQSAEVGGQTPVAAQMVAADASCQSNCESRMDLCLKEAKTDPIRDKCKVYFKGCLKSCSQGK
jgi:hypothetical protein